MIYHARDSHYTIIQLANLQFTFSLFSAFDLILIPSPKVYVYCRTPLKSVHKFIAFFRSKPNFSARESATQKITIHFEYLWNDEFVIEKELRHCTVRMKKLGNFNPIPFDQYRISGLVYHIFFL